MAAGFVFVLIPTTGEFIAPLLVGGPSSQLFGNSIQAFFSDTPDWNYGSVLALTLVAVVLVPAGAVRAVHQRGSELRGKRRDGGPDPDRRCEHGRALRGPA